MCLQDTTANKVSIKYFLDEFSIENNPLAQITTSQTDLDDLDRRYNALLQFVEENRGTVEPAQPAEILARSGPSMICGVPR